MGADTMTKLPKGFVLDKDEAELPNGFVLDEPSVIDPEEEYKQIDDIVDISLETGISIPDIEPNYRMLTKKPEDVKLQIDLLENVFDFSSLDLDEKYINDIIPFVIQVPEGMQKAHEARRAEKLGKPPPGIFGPTIKADTPTLWEKTKKFFVGEGALDSLPPDADRIEKLTVMYEQGMQAPWTILKYFRGRAVIDPVEIMWAALKRATPEDMWENEVKNMTFDEAFDWYGAYHPSGFVKASGEFAQFIGQLHTLGPLATKIGAVRPESMAVLSKARDTALLFGGASAADEITKLSSTIIDPTETEYGYEGPKAVLRDMAIGAAFSLVHSGVKGAWSKITPSEEARILKVLNFKKGYKPTIDEVRTATEGLSKRYQPGTIKSLRDDFANAVTKRMKSLREGGIVFRGQKVVYKPKLLKGETVQQQAIKLAEQPPTAPVKAPSKPTEAKKPVGLSKALSPEAKAKHEARKAKAKVLKETELQQTHLEEVGKPGLNIEDSYMLAQDVETGKPPGFKSVVMRGDDGKVIGQVDWLVDEKGEMISGIDEDGVPLGSMSIYVEPESRRQGIATQMMEYAKSKGYDLDKLAKEETHFTKAGKALMKEREAEGITAIKALESLGTPNAAEIEVAEAMDRGKDPVRAYRQYFIDEGRLYGGDKRSEQSAKKIVARIKKAQEILIEEPDLVSVPVKAPKIPVEPTKVEQPITKTEREQLRSMGMSIEEIGKAPVGELRKKIEAKEIAKTEEVVPDKEIESIIGKDIDDITIPKDRPGVATVPEMRAVVEAGKKVYDTILTFGEVRRQNPELYKRLMKTFGKRSAAMETAVDKLEKILPKTLSLEDDVLLANTYETKGQEPPERLKELYDNFVKILDENEKQILAEGILSKTFQERMIDENLARIATIEETLKHPSRSKRIASLKAENEKLKNMRYLPHTQVARNVIEGKINKLPDDKRKAYLDRLSYIYRQRSGKMTLKDYLDAGVIEKKDVRLSRLAAQTLADYQRRSAMKALHDLAKEQELIQPASKELREEGWLNQREIGITSPELKDKLIHPLYAQALREMVAAKSGRGGLRREIFAMVKIGQFIKPTIIYTYNAVQKMFRGMYSLNPKTEAVALRQAFHHVLNKTELYDKLNQDNLYQFPYEVSRGTQEEQLQMWINQHNPDIDRAIRYAEKITDTNFINADISKKRFIRNMFMSVHRAIGRITWTGDKVQRTQSYLINRKFGYSHDDAIKLASQSHGAYSELSKKYKDFMSKYFFVYSFRLLMPIEMAKVITEPLIQGAYKYANTGEVPPRHKMEQWAKAVTASIMIPVLVDSYMKWRGFEAEQHLGPVAWKYKKTVVVDGKEHELVVGLNYILNQPIKYWQRLISYNPIKPETRWMQSAKNVAKWEVHPLYRIFFWDISKNRRSFGTGQAVYDTETNPAVQFAQITKYVFGQSFRFFGGVMDAMGEGEMTELERERQKVILDESLSGFDRVLFTTLGYNYIRLPLEDRKRIASSQLKNEIFSRGITYHRKYEDEKLQRKMDELEIWAGKMQTWIETEMD